MVPSLAQPMTSQMFSVAFTRVGRHGGGVPMTCRRLREPAMPVSSIVMPFSEPAPTGYPSGEASRAKRRSRPRKVSVMRALSTDGKPSM